MQRRTCEYCGTEYLASEPKCPVCGGGSIQEEAGTAPAPKRRLASKAGARTAAGDQSPAPWGIISAIAGVLVLAGIVLFFVQMDFFREGGFDFNAIPTHLSQQESSPYEDALDNAQLQSPAEEDEVPEELPEEEPQADPNACTDLTISRESLVMDEAGGKVFLTAVARPTSCQEPIVFTSSDEDVVTVSDSGMITAIGPGEAEILVTCGTITKICTVSCTFEAEPVEEEEPDPEEDPEANSPEEPEVAPTLSKDDFTLFYPGEEYTLTVNNAPENAAISYVSSNSSVVTVDQSGKVIAKGDGDATITVTVGDVVLTCAARCRLDSSAEGGTSGSYTGPFTISHKDVTLFSVGETFTLTLQDSTGKTVSGISWSASNGAVSISGNQIKAVTAGQVTVKCVYNGETYSCIVRCTF